MTTVIGDSLGVGVSSYFKGKHDVKVGRNSADSLATLRGRKLGKRIVLEVGSNDTSAAELRRSLARARKQLKGHQVVLGLVGPGSPDAKAKNRVIREFARKTGGAVARPGQTSDGLHPTDYRRAARRIKGRFRGAGPTSAPPGPPPTTTLPAGPADLTIPRTLRETLLRGYHGR